MSSARETASSLLTIDFEAALAKLAWSQLQGSWQLPAELARLAIASGARSVEIEIEPRQLAVEARGARLDHRMISDFASILDTGLEAADRHQAMVALEERDAFVLSAIACSQPGSLRLTTGDDRGMELTLIASGALNVVNPSGTGLDQPDFRLRVDGLAVEAEKAARWLRRTGRFAGVPITINGDRIDRGFRAPLIETRLRIPWSRLSKTEETSLPTALAIPRHGNAPRLWLLRHGIIATHATVPGYPSFEAAVEMAQVSDTERSGPALTSRSTGAALRERLNPYIESLVDAAVGLTIRLARKAPALPEEVRGRTARLLLRAALKRRRTSEVSGVEIFPLALPDRAAGRRLVSVDVVSRLVRVEEGGTCALDAIPPGESPERFALMGHGALVLSQGERALLGELLRVVFSSPPARIRQRPGRRLLDLITARTPSLPFTGGTAVPESELTMAERTFLSRLRTAEAEGAFPAAAFRTGGGRVRRAGDGSLLLPRGNATVRACVQSVVRDPTWLYPATVALLGGRELPGPEVRRLWYASLEAG